MQYSWKKCGLKPGFVACKTSDFIVMLNTSTPLKWQQYYMTETEYKCKNTIDTEIHK